ncbi:unnamed protein product [Lymnaea stagnalis]|uniref:Peptidase M14 domain-containing protein n=1 Tax=Lymnaea stagnalis TaxID=6523 RepID=A0AAV2INJ1_LYMST
MSQIESPRRLSDYSSSSSTLLMGVEGVEKRLRGEDMRRDEGVREKQRPKSENKMSLEEKVRKMAEIKGMRLLEDEPKWREAARQKMESELSRRVREALETPPLERMQRRNQQAKQQKEVPDINAHLMMELSDKERDFLKTKRWKALQVKKQAGNPDMTSQRKQMELLFRDELSRSNYDEYPGVVGLDNLSEGIKNIREDYSVSVSRYTAAKPRARHFYTKIGFRKALKSGNIPNGVQFLDEVGTYLDKYGVVRNNDGPYWPVESVPMFATPRFKWWTNVTPEPLSHHLPASNRTIETQQTNYKGKWRGTQVAFDSERSPRDFIPLPVPEGCCPTLSFESRFECGNLRQARRIGPFEYELVLKADLFTLRHTQWYYFRVTNVVPGITYKFRIVNLLKSDSLYNHGMRPLIYSDKDAQEKQRGWVRTGHHISYSRNVTNHSCPLLQRGVSYHMLEWQMEFPNADDTYYLAHCYPYSFTDLKEDLEVLLNNEERSEVMRREVMCESKAGNSCFLLTVTNFNVEIEKKAVVISARVHPGESQASWMMKGLLEFITGPDPVAKELRNKFVFKIVPMINPDGVIVGNYRCSLAARDLNRNYRHPRRENFPTIWYLKKMVEDLAKNHEIALYCDLHGHSRKPNVFMYGNNTSTDGGQSPLGMARAFISERLFPWLMSVKSPEKFHFKSCKFSIRKCKESTGRVVMWRQMGIYNSFTLEATFSGTMTDRTKCRHFNILDFMEMGKVLAEVLMDYEKIQQDEVQHTKTVRDLTKVVTEQILTSRKLIDPEATLSDLSSKDGTKGKESVDKWTGALLTLLNTPRDTPADVSQANEVGVAIPDGHNLNEAPVYTKDDIVHMLEQLSSGPSLDDCLGLLTHLDIAEAIQESDSSDSDSESDPEMKPPDPKPKKKKKKSKKQRDKESSKSHASSADKKISEEVRSKSLPALSIPNDIARLPGVNTGATVVTDNSVQGQTKQPTATRTRQVPGFISKYEGRHNGGLPCFTEERCLERAAKKIAESRQRFYEDKTKDMSVYFVDEDGMHPISEEDLKLRLSDFSYGRPGSSTSMRGLNVRMGYTHAGLPQNGYLYSSPDNSDAVDATAKNLVSGMDDEFGFPMTSKRSPYQLLEPIEPKTTTTNAAVKMSYISQNLKNTLGVPTSISSGQPLLNQTTRVPLPIDPAHLTQRTSVFPITSAVSSDLSSGVRGYLSETNNTSRQPKLSALHTSDLHSGLRDIFSNHKKLTERLLKQGESNSNVHSGEPNSTNYESFFTKDFIDHSTDQQKPERNEQLVNHLPPNSLNNDSAVNGGLPNTYQHLQSLSRQNPPLQVVPPFVASGFLPANGIILPDHLTPNKGKHSEGDRRSLVE